MTGESSLATEPLLSRRIAEYCRSTAVLRKARRPRGTCPFTGTQIPDLTTNTPMGCIGAPASLMRAADGARIKIIASFDSGRVMGGLIVSTRINDAHGLTGKRLGARV